MLKIRLRYLSLLAVLAASPAFAQATTPSSPADKAVQRDVNQQERIEGGLKSGELSTGEAARLEKGASNIDQAESKALKDGTMTPQESARIQAMQNKESTRIYDAKHNDTNGNPASASSQRMQEDVQHNMNQEKRIDQGLDNGSLTNKEAGKLEKGQAHTTRKEVRAARSGHVSAAEQRRIQRSENRQSDNIKNAKHNKHMVTPSADVPATTPATNE